MSRRLMEFFRSCRGEKINNSVYRGACFWIFHTSIKQKNSPSICFDTLVMLLELIIKVSSLFLILFGIVKDSRREKKPNGVSFKLFLDSLNMKRLSSTSLPQTRENIWRVICLTVGYLFFGLDGLFMKKEHSNQSWLEEFSTVSFYTFLGLRD